MKAYIIVFKNKEGLMGVKFTDGKKTPEAQTKLKAAIQNISKDFEVTALFHGKLLPEGEIDYGNQSKTNEESSPKLPNTSSSGVS